MNNGSEMKECYFKIKPSDTLFFRDGYVFKKELNNHLESLNIPYPSVFYGAIFSALLRQGKFKDFLEIIKKDDLENRSDYINSKLKENFNLISIYLYDEEKNELYVKAPLDLFQNDYNISFGIYRDKALYSPRHEFSKYERVDDKFISLSDLIKYYSNNNTRHIELYPSDYFFKTYKKIGIEIDKISRTSKDENLYRLDMVEFSDKKFSYILKCKIDLKAKGFNNKKIHHDVVKLGGESKLASFTFTEKSIRMIDIINDFYKKQIIANNKVKILITSPMIVDDFNDFTSQNNIIYSVTGKPEYIGGFDMATGKQKPMRKAIPSGSILVMEDDAFKGRTLSQIIKSDQVKSMLEGREDHFRGFGDIILMPFRGNDE